MHAAFAHQLRSAGLDMDKAGNFKGLILSIGSGGVLPLPDYDGAPLRDSERVIVSVDSTGVATVAEPFGSTVNVSAANSWAVASSFSPGSSELLCTPVTFSHCGKFDRAVGNYVPEDPHGTTIAGQSSQGNPVNIACKDGYRVVQDTLPFSCYPGAAGCATAAGDAAGAVDIALQNYRRTCQGCRYVGTQKCAPVECEPHVADPTSERPAPNASAPVLFGQSVTVACADGFRAGVEPVAPERGLSPSANPRTSYERRCGVEVSLPPSARRRSRERCAEAREV